MARLVVVGDGAWTVKLLRKQQKFEAENLVINWEPRQNLAIDTRNIASGRDVGNVIVQRKTAEGLKVRFTTLPSHSSSTPSSPRERSTNPARRIQKQNPKVEKGARYLFWRYISFYDGQYSLRQFTDPSLGDNFGFGALYYGRARGMRRCGEDRRQPDRPGQC